MDRKTWEHLSESPVVVTVPLVVLAIPSLMIGLFLLGPMLFEGYFMEAIYVAPKHDVLSELGKNYHGVIGFTIHAFKAPPVYLAFAGVIIAWLLYIKFPDVPEQLAKRFSLIHKILLNKYGFDDLYQYLFAGGTRGIGELLWRFGDIRVIDGFFVNGTGHTVRWISGVVRTVQSGYLYDYAFAMIIGLLFLLGVFVHGILG